MSRIDEHTAPIPGAVCAEQLLVNHQGKKIVGRWLASIADISSLWKADSLHGDIHDLFLEISNRVLNHSRAKYLQEHPEYQSCGSLPRIVPSDKSLEGYANSFSIKLVLESEFNTSETILEIYEYDDGATEAPLLFQHLSSQILDSLPLGVIILDGQRRIGGWNSWMSDHATGKFKNGYNYCQGGDGTFLDLCPVYGKQGYDFICQMVDKVIEHKQSVFLSHVFHRELLPLVNKNHQNMRQNVAIVPLGDGCMIQITDMTRLVECDLLLHQQYEWIEENAKQYAAQTDDSEKWQNDVLTGLPNRIGWSQQFRSELIKSSHGTKFTLICLGVDRLKMINDSLGFLMGDRLLQEISTRLRLSFPMALIGRWDGDTFFVLCKDESFVDIPSILTQPYNFGLEDDFVVTFSVGVMEFTSETCNEPHKAIQSVEWALQDAKRTGRNRICYDEGKSEHRSRVFQIETGLRNALEREQMYILFQPQISFKTREVVGAEVLLRWKHPVLGLISPDVFIPIAEDSGIIGGLTYWVLESACKRKMAWNKMYPDWKFTMSVNLSVAQFSDPDLIKNIGRVIAETGVTPSELIMEITEGIILHDNHHNLGILDAIRNTGLGLSIDDFGNGYSSLSYLNSFKVNQIKLDKAFLLDSQNERLLGSLIRMSHDLNLEVVTEGVETAFQDRILTEQNCDIGQGFFFGRPVSDVEFVSFYQKTFPLSLPDAEK